MMDESYGILTEKMCFGYTSAGSGYRIKADTAGEAASGRGDRFERFKTRNVCKPVSDYIYV